jgi:AcrR family transcriptional regulator
MSRRQRTHHAAGDALVSLMVERPYRAITVEEVLSRADISRSTFYTHFDGKDDLLNSHYTRFFEFIAKSCMQRNGDSIRIAPVAFMLSHLSDTRYRHFYRALTRTEQMPELRAIAVERLTEKFENEFIQLARGRDQRIPRRVVARFVAASFIDVIDWWIDNDSPYSPQEMEVMFERLLRPVIESATGATLAR